MQEWLACTTAKCRQCHRIALFHGCWQSSAVDTEELASLEALDLKNNEKQTSYLD